MERSGLIDEFFQHGHLELFKLFDSYLIDTHLDSYRCLSLKSYSILQFLLKNNIDFWKRHPTRYLEKACSLKSLPMVKLFIENNVSVTIMTIIYSLPSLQIFKYLLEMKTINLANLVYTFDYHKYYIRFKRKLFLARFKLALKSGLDVNDYNVYGKTPLHYASKYCCYEICEILLDSGANPNFQDDKGETPIYSTLDINQNNSYTRKIFELLLNHGADPSIKTIKGKSCFDFQHCPQYFYIRHSKRRKIE